MDKPHHYNLTVKWTGNTGTGTSGYTAYERSHDVIINNKTVIKGSSDPAFRGDASRHNPEELLLASLSACHMLWYLHLCAEAGVTVLDYCDNASAVMVETKNGGGKFAEASLNPVVIVAESNMIDKANALHKKANELCYIASSVNFPIKHKPTCTVLK